MRGVGKKNGNSESGKEPLIYLNYYNNETIYRASVNHTGQWYHSNAHLTMGSSNGQRSSNSKPFVPTSVHEWWIHKKKKKKSEDRGGRDSEDEEQLNYQHPYIAGQLIDESNEASGADSSTTDNDKSNSNVDGSSSGNGNSNSSSSGGGGGSGSSSNANLARKHGETNENKSHNPTGSCSGKNNTILTELDKSSPT
ncbi:Pfemp3-like protein [Reticulomyxa filosa]|uniref:Pfemp3-like protein n=1 Tax=Reticulomyxa filosa TaxID=46433 RepID=X6MNP5_RETFI|nr:Pfemp3-like protein [Reticulomyxa filosa]|eukprot:ETO15623.1 Pfemp3-like protein [Reticulomyxa filosa]